MPSYQFSFRFLFSPHKQVKETFRFWNFSGNVRILADFDTFLKKKKRNNFFKAKRRLEVCLMGRQTHSKEPERRRWPSNGWIII